MSTSTSTFKVDFDLQMAKLNADLAKMNSDIQGMTTKTKARFNSLSGALAAGMFEGVSQKMSQMSSDIESMTSKIKSSFANMSSGIATGLLQGVGQKLASVVGSAMAAPGKALGQALTDSMELTAVNRKFDIVFGGLRGKAEEFSKTFAESISGSLTDTKAMMA